MPRTLYTGKGSSPARATVLTCKAVGLDFTEKSVKLLEGEQYSEWFTAINPRNCVPTLDDDGFILWESRSILRYIGNVYDKSGKLYPQDPKKRAKVDSALDFDLGHVYKSCGLMVYLKAFEGRTELEPKQVKDAEKALAQLEQSLTGHAYICGEDMTIADISLVASITFLEFIDYSLKSYPNILAWITRMKALPYYAECSEDFESIKKYSKTPEFRQLVDARFHQKK